MSFYEPQGWQAPVRQASWEQPPPPSRSGASSTSQRDDSNAFATQFEEVDRVIDNLVKSGKFFMPGQRSMHGGPMQGMSSDAPRGRAHDSSTAPAHANAGPRGHAGRHSIGNFDPGRSHPGAGLQNFYASQRHQGRHNEPDPMMHAKRRMAAQRERELRNYHQEQQYNRSLLSEMSSNKSDRSMSPSTLSEEGRRDLIARQHRALYGGESPSFMGQAPFGEDSSNRDPPATAPGAVRGPSPRGVDPFGMPSQTSQGDNSQGADIVRNEKAASPSAQGSSGFGAFDAQSQPSGKAATPPSGEETAHSRQVSKSTTAPMAGGMAPIGSRPNNQQPPNPGLNKRTTSPLPSSLGYGFGAKDQSNDRAGSASSNSNAPKESSAANMGPWGTGSGVWGSNKIGTTPAVWG